MPTLPATAEVVLAASQCRTTITEAYQSMRPGLAAVAADSWGCEAGLGTDPQPSLYVTSVSTSADGVITVTADEAAFPNTDILATANQITLTPQDSAGTAFAVGTNNGQQVYQWVCGPGANPMPLNYLPGSCRG